MQNNINIGILGLGNVGCGLVELINKNQEIIADRINCQLNIKQALVKDPTKKRDSLIKDIPLTSDWHKFINDPTIDIFVELTGDKTLALKSMRHILAKNKYFITANKSLLAEHSAEVWSLFQKYPQNIGFEASVGGSLPIMRSLRESYVADRINLIAAIINGTSNYILSLMEKEGVSFEMALANAQKLGYAEPNPKLDINGLDSGHKTNISATLAFHRQFNFDEMFIEGIENIGQTDIEYANKFGYVIKLLGIAKRINKKYSIVTHPTLISKNSILAKVEGVNNAFLVRGEFMQDGLIHGLGAGAQPTAVAVAADIIEVIRNKSSVEQDEAKYFHSQAYNFKYAPIIDYQHLKYQHYIHLIVDDKIGVLNKITNLFSEEKVSINKIFQNKSQFKTATKNNVVVDLIIFTHLADNASIERIIQKVIANKISRHKPKHIRLDNEI